MPHRGIQYLIGLHETDDIQSPYAAGYAFKIMLRGIL